MRFESAHPQSQPLPFGQGRDAVGILADRTAEAVLTHGDVLAGGLWRLGRPWEDVG